MEYKKGFKIKPYEILKDGNVRFTNGTDNNISASEIQCRAYGYLYDSDLGVCRAYVPIPNVGKIGKPIGTSNSRDSLEIGKHHTLSQNQNTIVTGSNHIVPNRLVDSAVIGGSFGKPTHKGEVVFGGGVGGGVASGTAGYNQTSIVSLTGQTRGDDINLTIQGDGTSEIRTESNTIMIYEVFITGVSLGGGSSSIGDYCGYKFRGVCKTNNDGDSTATTTQQWREVTGITGTPSLDFTDNHLFHVSASGDRDVTARWSAVVNMYINRISTEI